MLDSSDSGALRDRTLCRTFGFPDVSAFTRPCSINFPQMLMSLSAHAFLFLLRSTLKV